MSECRRLAVHGQREDQSEAGFLWCSVWGSVGEVWGVTVRGPSSRGEAGCPLSRARLALTGLRVGGLCSGESGGGGDTGGQTCTEDS